jgi:hypothetical protein
MSKNVRHLRIVSLESEHYQVSGTTQTRCISLEIFSSVTAMTFRHTVVYQLEWTEVKELYK